jgi:hypothetical protein
MKRKGLQRSLMPLERSALAGKETENPLTESCPSASVVFTRSEKKETDQTENAGPASP